MAKPEPLLTAVLSVKRFQLVESATLTSEQFALAAKRQWLAGLHKLSVQVVTAGSAHPLGSSPPQGLSKGIVLALDGLLTVQISPITTYPLLIKVMGHPNNGPGSLLGIATIDPTQFFTEVVSTRITDHPMTTLQLTVPVMPSCGLAANTVHAVIAMEITAELPKELQVPIPVPPPLEFRSGPIRLSVLDLYFPAFVLATDGLTVSNVICVSNVSRSTHWVNVQASATHFTTSPAEGLVLQPGQRGYLAVTLARPSSAAVAAPAQHLQPALPSSFVSSSAVVAELYCVELETREACAPTPFRLHDDAPRASDEMIRPFHYWLNGSCLTNRPVPADEAVYIRSVLPLFASEADPVADRADADAMANASAGGLAVANAAQPTLVRDKDSGSISKAGAGGRVVPSSPSRLIVELANRVCRCTLRFGEIRGSAIPSPPVCPPFQSGYRLVLTSMHASWTVEVGETPIVLPHAQSGTLDFSQSPLVVRKDAIAEPHQALRITLFEVTNAAPAGASYTTVAQPARPSDEIPIAVGVLTLWPLHRSAMLRPLPVSLLFLDSFARYDSMPCTGVSIRRSEVTFVPLEAQR